MKAKKALRPQLPLRLDAAAPAADTPWRAGGSVAYLGRTLTLILDTACRLPERVGDELHLPLPPAAEARQIRDAAESWLRDEAQRIFTATLQQKSVAAGRRPLRITLAFGKCGDWVKHEDTLLRCHWRLVEQPASVIDQILGRAFGQASAAPACDDLFALM